LYGGFIANPSSPTDQGLAETEPLYVDMVTDATLGPSATTVTLEPGDGISVPTDQTTNVTVNAASSGHRFSAFAMQPAPVVTILGTFPPAGPTGLLKTLPSYLYQQYADDADLQEFVTQTNAFQQGYVDWYNDTGLPIYTGLVGPLLDWVGDNLYGIFRPSLSSGATPSVGPLNTFLLNSVPFNDYAASDTPPFFQTDDDTYKRIITWAFYKGDGKNFSMRWLKRRLKRFMTGVNGVDPGVSETYDVSVSFGDGNNVNIHLLTNTPLLKEAIDSGVVELPYQFTWNVTTP
jgi:hypothetical protein